MTRKTYFAVAMMAMMTMFTNQVNAQQRGHNHDNAQGYSINLSNNKRAESAVAGGMMAGNRNQFNDMPNNGMTTSGRGHNDNARVVRYEDAARQMGDARREMNVRNVRYEDPRVQMGHRNDRRFDSMREMHGHRWDRDGWMEGWHGRVRHFDDGRWGYFRDGAWFYYDCFYEPDFYFARPVVQFESHTFTRGERTAVAVTAGVVAVAALITALAD